MYNSTDASVSDFHCISGPNHSVLKYFLGSQRDSRFEILQIHVNEKY